jgi:hypothetical protein
MHIVVMITVTLPLHCGPSPATTKCVWEVLRGMQTIPPVNHVLETTSLCRT